MPYLGSDLSSQVFYKGSDLSIWRDPSIGNDLSRIWPFHKGIVLGRAVSRKIAYQGSNLLGHWAVTFYGSAFQGWFANSKLTIQEVNYQESELSRVTYQGWFANSKLTI